MYTVQNRVSVATKIIGKNERLHLGEENGNRNTSTSSNKRQSEDQALFAVWALDRALLLSSRPKVDGWPWSAYEFENTIKSSPLLLRVLLTKKSPKDRYTRNPWRIGRYLRLVSREHEAVVVRQI